MNGKAGWRVTFPEDEIQPHILCISIGPYVDLMAWVDRYANLVEQVIVGSRPSWRVRALTAVLRFLRLGGKRDKAQG
jgi:hypothetical protein